MQTIGETIQQTLINLATVYFYRKNEILNYFFNKKSLFCPHNRPRQQLKHKLQWDVSQTRKSSSVFYKPAFFPGTSCGQTTSDMEALHQAYHHVDQSLGDTDEQKLHSSAAAVSEGLGQSISQNNDIYAKNMSTVDSGKQLKGRHVLYKLVK